MTRLFFLSLFIAAITNGYSQIVESVINDVNEIVFRDSLGNIITAKKAKQLLQTGKYISIPILNNSSKIESIIRKPRNEDKDTYQTYTGDNTIISTMGYKKRRSSYNMGDTLPAIEVKDYYGTELVLKKKGYSVLIFWEDVEKIKSNLDDRVEMLTALIQSYPHINFVLCPESKSLKLSTYLPQRLLKGTNNIYLATDHFLAVLDVKDAPIYMVVDPTSMLKIFVVPPPGNQLMPFFFLKEYLSKAVK